MFWLYCLPGRILLYLQWLFPEGEGSAAGTQRRKDSKFAHFLSSTLVYLLIAGIAYAVAHRGERKHHNEQSVETEDVGAGRPEVDQSGATEDVEAVSPSKTPTPNEAVSIEDDASPSPTITDDAVANAERAEPDPAAANTGAI